MPSYGGLVEPRVSSLTPLKSTFNAEHFLCRSSWSILNDFGAIHCQNVYYSLKSRKFTKTPILGVQGRSRSSMLVPPESSSAVLVMVGSKFVSICNRFHARRANSGKITFRNVYPSLVPSIEGNLVTQRHEIYSQETRDSTLLYGINHESLSHMGFNRYRVVTDGRACRRTDGQTELR